jgi:Glycosyl transferases group 1
VKLLIAELWAFQHYVSREFSYIMHELIHTYGWQLFEMAHLWKDARHLKDSIYAQCGTMPEVILFWSSEGLFNSRASEVFELPSHRCFFADDLHWHHEKKHAQRYISFVLCDTIFATYGYQFEKFYPNLAKSRAIEWIPHAASPDFLLPLNEQAENRLFLSGAINGHYPLRQQVKALYDQQAYPIAYHQHPGYHCRYHYERDENVGSGYAAKIHHYRVGFTDASKYGYTVAKYFEIPATGALLLADDTVREPLQQLGFEAYVHYIPAAQHNLEQQIQYVLDEPCPPEIDRIRKQGQRFIRERHTTHHRAEQIDRVCQGYCR